MKVPDSRAAIKRFELSPTGVPVPPENYGKVHALLLNDPAQRWNHHDLRRFGHLKTSTHIERRSDAPEAVCGRKVQYVYTTQFDPEQSDACPDCKKLLASLQIDPRGYWRYARSEHERIREHDRLNWERHRAREAGQTELQRLLHAVDESYDDRPPEQKNITERATQAKPDKSGTA